MKIWPVFPVTTVGALIERADGEILLVRTHEWRDELGVPGGKGTYGERLEVALHRQVKEETGLEICDVRFILAQEAVPRARLPAWKRGSRKSHLAYAPPLIAVAGASNPLAVRKHELLK